MIEESKYCTDMMKNRFNKKIVLTREDDEDLQNSAKCWICYNAYVYGDIKIRNHIHITGKYRGSA